MTVAATERVIELLRERTAEAGSMRAWADAHEMSHTYVADVARGAKPPGPRLLLALGLAKVVSYQSIVGGRP